MDLNHDKQIQSLLCYRYTIGQTSGSKLKPAGMESRLQLTRVCGTDHPGIRKAQRTAAVQNLADTCATQLFAKRPGVRAVLCRFHLN